MKVYFIWEGDPLLTFYQENQIFILEIVGLYLQLNSYPEEMINALSLILSRGETEYNFQVEGKTGKVSRGWAESHVNFSIGEDEIEISSIDLEMFLTAFEKQEEHF